jgi:TPR repeat protein
MPSYRNEPKPDHDERWRKALDEIERGNGEGAVFMYKSLAADGCAAALAQLGRIYEHGAGHIETDVDQAIKWYQRSIEIIDDVGSHLGLVRIYLGSTEIDKDRSLTLYHLKVLEQTDITAAYFALGLLHETGSAVEKDEAKAAAYYRKASERGHLLARLHLQRLTLAEKPIRTALAAIGTRFAMWRARRCDPTDPRLGLQEEEGIPLGMK